MGMWKYYSSVLSNKWCLSVYAEKSGMNQREEVLTRLSGYTVHPSRNAGNQRNHKGKRTTTTRWGAPYLGKSRDIEIFIFAVAALVQTSVVALICCCISAAFTSEKSHRITRQVAFLSFQQRVITYPVHNKEKEQSTQSQKYIKWKMTRWKLQKQTDFIPSCLTCCDKDFNFTAIDSFSRGAQPP